MNYRAVLLAAGLALSGCGSSQTITEISAKTRTTTSTHASTSSTSSGGIPQGHPQAVEPNAGVQGTTADPTNPVGDPNAHAPPLSQVRQQLKLELVAAAPNNSTYINPLRFVTVWERTDQGVDAQMPIGAPILAPCRIKILAIEPDWYAGQPLVYWELLEGPDAGRVQFVAEQITSIARPGSILQQGQAIARYAPSGTAIEFGWSTPQGITLAMATTGYEEGQVTPAGRSMRNWLNALGANAGPS